MWAPGTRGASGATGYSRIEAVRWPVFVFGLGAEFWEPDDGRCEQGKKTNHARRIVGAHGVSAGSGERGRARAL